MSIRNITALEKEIEELERLQNGNPEPEEVEEEVEEQETGTSAKPQEEAPAEEKGWAKRYGDLRRLQQAQAKELKELKAKKSEPAPSAITKEQVEDWVKNNPKAADIVRTLAREVTPVEDVSEIKEEIARTKAMSAILKSHPDFEEITESDEFHDWADKQPASVQALVFSDKAEDVVWALSFYKSQTGEKTDPKKDAAKLVKTKSAVEKPADASSKSYSESMVEKMSLEEYEKHEKAILEAQRNGNFVYDRSGGAR